MSIAVQRNPHAGAPFTENNAAIAAALEDLSIPALLCSLVHMTGDPSWIRDGALERVAMSMDFQCGLSEQSRADIRRRALPVIAAYREGGCEPQELPRQLLLEMMAFLAGRPLEGSLLAMMLEDMQFDGADARVVRWGDEVPAEAKAASPVIVSAAVSPAFSLASG
jgi:4-hydroxyacetophenone monooxygenase